MNVRYWRKADFLAFKLTMNFDRALMPWKLGASVSPYTAKASKARSDLPSRRAFFMLRYRNPMNANDRFWRKADIQADPDE